MAFIIPLSTMIYATVGGLKATFTTSYMHTVIIFVVCTLFMFQVYVPNNIFGGIDDVSFAGTTFHPLACIHLYMPDRFFFSAPPRYCTAIQLKDPLVLAVLLQRAFLLQATLTMCAVQVYERLKQMAIYFPVADQDAGSYLTINSNAGVQFMFIFFLSGLSQMLVSIITH